MVFIPDADIAELLEAVPSFQESWREAEAWEAKYVADFPDDTQSPEERVEAFLGQLASHLGRSVANDELHEVEWLGAPLEKVYSRLPENVAVELTVSFLESLIYGIEYAGGDRRKSRPSRLVRIRAGAGVKPMTIPKALICTIAIPKTILESTAQASRSGVLTNAEADALGGHRELHHACFTRLQDMQRLLLAVAISSAFACSRVSYLPQTTLRHVAPSCGARPIAPRAQDRGPTHFACQVDDTAQAPTERPLVYPTLLADGNVESDVRLQFVVDEHGHVDSTTVRVLASGHDLFTQAARESLRQWGAQPAMRRGRAVRQLTTQAFCFRLGGAGAVARCAQELARFRDSGVTVACAEGQPFARKCSHGPCVQPPPHRPPNVRCS
jgi:TonB family protein